MTNGVYNHGCFFFKIYEFTFLSFGLFYSYFGNYFVIYLAGICVGFSRLSRKVVFDFEAKKRVCWVWS